MKKALLGIAVAAAVLAAVMRLRGGTDGTPGPGSRTSPTPAAHSAAARPSSELVLSIAPGAARNPAPATATRSPMSPLMNEYAKRREYKSIYDRLKASAARTPEETWVLAQILDSCATVTDRNPPRRSGWKLGGDRARARFVAALGDKAPNRAQRIAAFDRINVDPCAGFESIESTDGDIRAMLERAAASGDAKAKATLLMKDLESSARPAGMLPTVTDAQLDTFRQVIASGDPRAIVDVVAMFSFFQGNLSVRTGPDEAPLDYLAMHSAATLAACDLGYPCGPDSRFLSEACALSGQCDAASYRDYLFYYMLPPGTSQLADDYHVHLLRAINDADWSYFTFHRGPPPAFAPFQPR
jgi:hypothetical protein